MRAGVRPAAFLDRDGVLNESTVLDGVPRPPSSVEELQLLPDAAAACEALRDAGIALVVVTNQPDVARGAATLASVTAINDQLCRLVPLDDVLVCPHDDADDCSCRKPRPGLLLAAAARHGLDLRRSVMVGDRWRDIAAGEAAGVATVFVDRGYAEVRPEHPDLVVGGLGEAVEFIIERAQGEQTPCR